LKDHDLTKEVIGMKSISRRTLYIAATGAVACVLIIAVYVTLLSSSSPPEIGLQVEDAGYDPSTQWFQVSGTIAYEIPAMDYVHIRLIAIKDGERTIDVENGSYGLYYISLGGQRRGPDWAISLQNIELTSTNLQLTFSFELERQTPLSNQFIVLDSGIKKFSVTINS